MPTFLSTFTDDLLFPVNMFNFRQINHLTEICGDSAYGEEKRYTWDCQFLISSPCHLYQPRHSHSTPSPEKGAIVGRWSAPLRRCAAEYRRPRAVSFFSSTAALQQQKKIIPPYAFAHHNAALSAQAAESVTSGQRSCWPPAVQEAKAPERKDWCCGAKPESAQCRFTGYSRSIQPL